MGLETYSLRRCRTAAVAAAVLALACSVAAASSSSPADGGGTDDSQTAAAGSTPLIGDASAESHGGARRSLAYDDDDGDHHSRHRRTCHPGYQPGPHGKPQPCPPGTAKGHKGCYSCKRCDGKNHGRQEYQSRSGATRCQLCPMGGRVNKHRTKCVYRPRHTPPPPGLSATPLVPVRVAFAPTQSTLGDPADLIGQTYVDSNGDGSKQTDEPLYPLTMVICDLTDPAGTRHTVPTIESSANGTISLQVPGSRNIVLGRYNLSCTTVPHPLDQDKYNPGHSSATYDIVLPSHTPPPPGLSAEILIPVRAAIAPTRFENVTLGGPADLSGQTYVDSNGDGSKQPDEPPYPLSLVGCELTNPVGTGSVVPVIRSSATGSFSLQVPGSRNSVLGRYIVNCTTAPNGEDQDKYVRGFSSTTYDVVAPLLVVIGGDQIFNGADPPDTTEILDLTNLTAGWKTVPGFNPLHFTGHETVVLPATSPTHPPAALSIAGTGAVAPGAALFRPPGTWTTTASLPAPSRWLHQATLLADGSVLVSGGVVLATNASTNVIAGCQLYKNGVWSPTGNLITPRYGHRAVLLQDGSVLVAGGRSDTVRFASAERYTPATGTWSPAGELAAPLDSFAMAVLPTGDVLTAGGLTGGLSVNDPPPTTLNTSQLYFPANNSWSAPVVFFVPLRDAEMLPMEPGRCFGTTCVGAAGGAIVMGGVTPAEFGFPERAVPASNVYDAAAIDWMLFPETMSVARAGFRAMQLADGDIVVSGCNDICPTAAEESSVERLSAKTGTWTTLPSTNGPRTLHTMVVMTA